nr:unnamed protein product [Digitaria exilis]
MDAPGLSLDTAAPGAPAATTGGSGQHPPPPAGLPPVVPGNRDATGFVPAYSQVYTRRLNAPPGASLQAPSGPLCMASLHLPHGTTRTCTYGHGFPPCSRLWLHANNAPSLYFPVRQKLGPRSAATA